MQPTSQHLDLDAIETRADVATDGPWERYEKYGPDFFACTSGSYLRGVGTFNFGDGTDADADEEFVKHAVQDVRALVAEVRRLRDRVTELETYANGCDAEGCVLPHSSWCEAAKKTAAENDGCTCGRPWKGHPQPHAMHCWTVNPPRNEVEEMRKRIAELSAVEEAHVVADTCSDPEHANDRPGCIRPCGHDDYHDPHDWADRPSVWCPGISYADDDAPAARPADPTT